MAGTNTAEGGSNSPEHFLQVPQSFCADWMLLETWRHAVACVYSVCGGGGGGGAGTIGEIGIGYNTYHFSCLRLP